MAEQNGKFAALLRDIAVLAQQISPSAAPRKIKLTRAIISLQTVVATDVSRQDSWVHGSSRTVVWHSSPLLADSLRLVAERAVREYPGVAVRACALLDVAQPGSEDVKEIRQAAAARAATLKGVAWRRRARRRPKDTGVAVELDALVARGPDVSGLDIVERREGLEGRVAAAAGSGLAPVLAPALRDAYFGDPSADLRFMGELRSAVAEGFVRDAPLSDFDPLLRAVAADHGVGRALAPQAVGMSAVGTSAVGTSASTEVETINLSGLREYFAGRSVCLVANSADLLEHRLGDEIDAHDVVVRFNSFAIDPAHTGARTDVHATIHLHDFNWDVPVDVRLVFSGSPVWAKSVAKYLRPEAQRFLGDESVRWPRATLLDEEVRRRVRIPTTGLNMITLLDYLDVSTAIDLYGFNFHAGRPYRRDDAMHLPVVGVHSYSVERDWVMERAVATAPSKISLR